MVRELRVCGMCAWGCGSAVVVVYGCMHVLLLQLLDSLQSEMPSIAWLNNPSQERENL